MHLYMIPMTCSFAAHVACLEAGLAPNLVRVDRATKRLDDGSDYRALAPQGNVPVLRTEDGWQLGESSAVLQYIADQSPDKQLAPPAGSRPRYELAQWLNFVSTELHKKHLWMMFATTITPEHKAWARASIVTPLAHVEHHLATRPFLLGERFTVADCYLFWTLFVAPHGGASLDAFPVLRAYVETIRARRSVAQALAYEVPLFQRDNARAAT